MIAYCDYIADRIKTGLNDDAKKVGTLIGNIGKINYDLTETGSFKSTKKTMSVIDVNGKFYRVTVEEV
jgi:uncharacterized membrane protein